LKKLIIQISLIAFDAAIVHPDVLQAFVIDKFGYVLAVDKFGDNKEAGAPIGHFLNLEHVDVALSCGQHLA